MFTLAVAPVVTARTGGARTHLARVQSFGLSEVKVGELLADLMAPGRQPLVGTTAGHGVIGIRVVARGASDSEARSTLEADLAEIRSRLGDAAYGRDDDTLEGVIGALLTERGVTLATAESCTGGLLAKRITDIPGSSRYFLRGYVTYADRSKTALLCVPTDLIAERGAVSEGVAEAMASGCRMAAGTDLAVSITGVAGPGGGTPSKPVGLVYVGLAHGGGVTVKRFMMGDHLGRCEIRDRTCSVALNLLRLHLLRSDS